MPGTSVRSVRHASRAAAIPACVSWSVSATTSRPAAWARLTTSAGSSVPSEALLWTCRSMRTAAIVSARRSGAPSPRPGRRVQRAPNGRSRSCSGSRRSRSASGSTRSAPAVSGQSTSQTQLAATSPTNTAFPSDSTTHSGASWLATRTVACGARRANPSPGSGPGSPARPAPRPTPGSSAMISRSAGPPSGLGPDSATAEARAPVRSSPAPVNPLTSQPAGSGQGSQTGTVVWLASSCRPSRDGSRAGASGAISPCRSQHHALVHTVGACARLRQRGHTALSITLRPFLPNRT